MRAAWMIPWLLLGLSLSAVPTAAQDPRYAPWPDQADRLQKLIDELRPLIERSRRTRVADPLFLDDLEAVLARYETPWTVPLLFDDFRDGDYTRDPAWTVHSGAFFIDRRLGLRSRVAPELATRRYFPELRGARQTLIGGDMGIPIGNLTLGSGLSAAFDGVYGGARVGTPGCARGRNGDIGYVGKDWGPGVARIITGFRAFGASDIGFNELGDPTVTITLQGSNDNFNTDINDLGSASAEDAPGLQIQALSSLAEIPFRYHRLRVTNTAWEACVAEVEFYESGPPWAGGRAPAHRPAATDVADPGHAISSGELHRGALGAFAFDDDPGTSWASHYDGPGNAYRAFIGQDFGPQPRHIRSVYLTQRQDSANGNASRVDVQRWVNGLWQTVQSFPVVPDRNRQLLRLPPSGAAARWRLLATATYAAGPGAYWHVAELEFLEAAVPAPDEAAGLPSEPGGQAGQPSLEEIGARILKQILQGGRPGGASQYHGDSPDTQVAQGRYRPHESSRADSAEIATELPITNAFAIRLRLTAVSDDGRLLFGPYQGGDRRAGYRLAYNPGNTPSIELLRVGRHRHRVIETHDEAVGLSDGRPHLLEWTRARDGTMTVSIDSHELMRVQDRRFRDPFDGFTLVNRGGEYAVRAISIDGAP